MSPFLLRSPTPLAADAAPLPDLVRVQPAHDVGHGSLVLGTPPVA